MVDHLGPCQWGVLGAILWLSGAAAVAAQDEPAHVFSEVFFCQSDSPFLDLAQSLDNIQLFWFNFSRGVWHPRLPDFQPETESRTSKDEIHKQSQICQFTLEFLTNFSGGVVPEAKGIPQVEVFTLRPFQLGQPNTLVCSISNIFPPSVNILWEHQWDPVSKGVSTTQIYPLLGLDFQVFSYLDMIPRAGEVYSCSVKTPGDKSSTTAFWVPKDPINPHLLENVLCALAFALGIILAILGATVIILTCKSRNAD